MRKVLGLLLLLSVVSAAWAQERQDTIVVSRDGTGNFRTLQEAIESARAFMDYTVTIYVKNGVYKEKVIVPSWVENIDIIGEDRDKTIITYDDHANINKMGTFRTYTVKVEGSDITFKNLTIENNAAQLGQAVALHTEGDRLKFINCRILGNQDTIYTGAKFTRLYFKDCYIDGTTDFIFGPSTALFEDCIIHSKRNSYVTAASTPKEAKYGYVFKHCKLTAEPRRHGSQGAQRPTRPRDRHDLSGRSLLAQPVHAHQGADEAAHLPRRHPQRRGTAQARGPRSGAHAGVLPARAVRRPAPARAHRHGPDPRPEAGRRRRAHHRPRRDRAEEIGRAHV